MQSATDVRTALEVGTRHFRLHNPGVSVECREARGYCVLNYTILDHGEPGDEQTLDMAIAGMFRVMQSLCGYHWQPVEVRFAHARPRNLTPFRKLLKAPLVFDAEDSALVFRSHWLQHRLSSADPLIHLFMQEHIAEVEAERGEDLSSHLQRVLPSLVTSHRATPAEAARRLGVGVRTLNRRLAAAGTTFSALVDRSRQSIAAQLLGHTILPPGQVARRLGYVNTSAFTRAFRRWNGMTPSEWRKKAGPDPAAASMERKRVAR
jgi:AraC-like DNA-binding protein